MLAPPGAVVCVPARNEQEHLPALLRSLAAQRGFGPDGRLGIVILANGCTDRTARIARAFPAERLAIRVLEPDLRAHEAHVGTARRLALEHGAEWLEADGWSEGVLLTTDADATLPEDWVAANLAALRQAEIVGGALVVADPGDPALARLNAAVARYWEAVRAIEDRIDPPPHDPAPRHGDHTGASLALRLSTYRVVGGLPPLRRGEDNALVSRVVSAGGRLRHDPAVRVRVSDRVVGRAEGGMAADMTRRHAAARSGGDYRLPHPDHWRRVVGTRATLRAAWRLGMREAEAALAGHGIDPAAIDLAACPNDGAFVERATAHLALPEPEMVPVETALALFDPPAAVRGAA